MSADFIEVFIMIAYEYCNSPHDFDEPKTEIEKHEFLMLMLKKFLLLIRVATKTPAVT